MIKMDATISVLHHLLLSSVSASQCSQQGKHLTLLLNES